MKLLKKINLGLILTIIVVLAVAIYSINVELKRNKEKDTIKTVCEDFIKTTSDYVSLPEEYQSLANKISEEDFNNYINEMKDKLKEKMIDNNDAIDIQATILETELEEQLASQNIVTNFERKITKLSSYTFDGNQVTVSFKSKVDKEIKYTENGEEKTKNDAFDTVTETIILQKVDNVWKVVYSDLEYSRDSAYGYAEYINY